MCWFGLARARLCLSYVHQDSKETEGAASHAAKGILRMKQARKSTYRVNPVERENLMSLRVDESRALASYGRCGRARSHLAVDDHLSAM